MSKVTKQLKSNRDKLYTAAQQLAGDENRAADFSFAMARVSEIDGQLKTARALEVREPDMYGEGSPYSVIADVISAQTNALSPLLPSKFEAQARLARYAQTDGERLLAKRSKATEKAQAKLGVRSLADGGPISYRDLSTLSAGSSFVPPAFLLGEWEGASRANSVAQSVCKVLPLPPSCDQILVPAVTESYNAEAITAENVEPFSGGIQSSAYVSVVGVRQYAQIVRLSLQLLERGGAFLESVLVGDANAGLNEQIDLDLIQGNGAPEAVIPGVAGTVAGQILGVYNNAGIATETYTDATPTAIKQYAAIVSGIKGLDDNRRRPPQHLLMLPSLYHEIAGSVDTVGSPVQPIGIGDDDNDGVVKSADVLGYLAGVPVLGAYGTGYGFGTTGDENIVVVGRFKSDALLLVSEPAFNFLDEGQGANQLSVSLVVRQYVAFCVRNTNGFLIVGGTGFKRS